MSTTDATPKPTLHTPDADPLGVDTSDPAWMQKLASAVLSGGRDQAAIRAETTAALRRWGMSPEGLRIEIDMMEEATALCRDAKPKP